MFKRVYLMIEFWVLCLLIPTLIIVNTWAPMMFTFLWGAALYAFFIYRRHFFTTWRAFWSWESVTWDNLKPILIRWGLASLGMYGFMVWYDPDRLFGIFYRSPEFIPFLMVAYPVLSALPQEFIFCSFFFKRYEHYFGSGRAMVIASALVFAYAHVLYINPVAPTLGLLAGLIFADTYAKTKSLALVTIEHGLYGNSLFLIGLGWYFYSGSVVQ